MNTEGTMKEFYEVMEQVLVSHQLKDSISDMHRHIHDKRKPLDEVSSILLKKGFYPDNVEHDLFSYKFADGTTMFRHFFIRLAFLPAWIKIVPETRQEEIFNRIENVINEISEEKGYFELTIPFVVISAIKL